MIYFEALFFLYIEQIKKTKIKTKIKIIIMNGPDMSVENLLEIQCEQIEEKINELKIIRDNFEDIEKSFRREIAFRNKSIFSESPCKPDRIPRGQNLDDLIYCLITNIKLKDQN